MNLPRRRALALGLAVASLPACSNNDAAPLRFAAHPWPGYELLYLARQGRGWPAQALRLVETPSASASLRGLANQMLEGAALTLDEVLTARSRGIGLVVVTVVDVSMGADVVLVRPALAQGRRSLAGRLVGVEPSATGTVMLNALLHREKLALQELRVVALAVDQHVAAYRSGRVEALVTHEPARSALRAEGAVEIFSSAEIPGQIVDTLAVRPEVLKERPQAVRALVGAYFKGLGDWRAEPARCEALMAPRLQLKPEQVPATFSALELPDAAQNRAWLQPAAGAGRLMAAAQGLLPAMVQAGLLPGAVPLEALADDRFLP